MADLQDVEGEEGISFERIIVARERRSRGVLRRESEYLFTEPFVAAVEAGCEEDIVDDIWQAERSFLAVEEE